MLKFFAALVAVAFLAAPASAADVPSACPSPLVLVQVVNSNAVSAIGNSRACLRELNGDQNGGGSASDDDSDSDE